jgi:cytochrome c-type biogenesis protein CcmH
LRRFILMLALTLTLLPQTVFAVQPDEMLKDEALEARARHLSSELRCPVCQNQSIDDSEAPIARDLRLLIRQRLSAGDTDQQALDFLVARYGNFVLLKPPMQFDTLLLWAIPPLALCAGMVALVLAARRRRLEKFQTPGLSVEEQARVSALLEKRRP